MLSDFCSPFLPPVQSRSQTPVASGLREPWQQAEQANHALAETYDALGLADYEAIEAFARADLS